MGWEVGGGSRGDETRVYLWLIHVHVWQKTTQRCKANILQLKIKNNFFLKGGRAGLWGCEVGLASESG